jgi:hypothetical protein
MKHRGDMTGQWAVRILCVLGLLLVGFAHQPPASADQAGSFEAYRLPDGSLQLCTTAPDDTGKGTSEHKLHAQGCEACRIAASVLVPTPTDATGLPLRYDQGFAPPRRREALHRKIYPPSTGPRAPPSTPIMI